MAFKVIIVVVNIIIATVASVIMTKYTPLFERRIVIPKILQNFETVFTAVLIWLVLMYYSTILFEEMKW